MKHFITFVALAFVAMSTIQAQDVITTKDGSDIQAKILEVTQTELKYKKFSNPDGPTFTISKSDVLIVRYENGEKEVFKDVRQSSSYKPNTTENVTEGMSYSQYKDYYDKKYYIAQPGDPYSPTWAGVASFLIPGLGQGVAGEWGRAAWIIGANVGFTVVALLFQESFVNYLTYYNQPFPAMYIAVLAGWLAFDIWSITDAVKIAKVKNMYNQDIRGQRTAELHYSLSPCVAPAPDFGGGLQMATGMSLTLSF